MVHSPGLPQISTAGGIVLLYLGRCLATAPKSPPERSPLHEIANPQLPEARSSVEVSYSLACGHRESLAVGDARVHSAVDSLGELPREQTPKPSRRHAQTHHLDVLLPGWSGCPRRIESQSHSHHLHPRLHLPKTDGYALNVMVDFLHRVLHGCSISDEYWHQSVTSQHILSLNKVHCHYTQGNVRFQSYSCAVATRPYQRRFVLVSPSSETE